MRSLLLSVIIGFSLTARSQCGTIQYDGVIPNPVYDTTHAYLNLQVSCNEMITLMDQNVTIVGSSIMVDAFYCYGWLQVLTTTNDSIPLGVLPAGTYTYSVNVYSTYSPVTNCMAYSPADYASGTFNVLPIVNSLEKLDETDFEIYPNPTTSYLNIESRMVIEEVQIHDVNGYFISSSFPNEKHTVTEVESLADGNYFIHLISDGTKLVKRIVIQ